MVRSGLVCFGLTGFPMFYLALVCWLCLVCFSFVWIDLAGLLYFSSFGLGYFGFA